MDWQMWLVAVAILLAAGYVARQTWRTWSRRKGGCGGCGCSKPPAAGAPRVISSDELTARLRSRS